VGHIEHIFSKIDTSTRAKASRFAMQQGLLPDDEFATGERAEDAASNSTQPPCIAVAFSSITAPR